MMGIILLLVLLYLVGMAADRAHRQMSHRHGWDRFLRRLSAAAWYSAIVLTLVYALVIPLRTIGLLPGPR